jgi:minor extracellular serine protease Vpr
MNRKVLFAVGTTALLIVGMLPSVVAARSPGERQFERVTIGKIDKALVKQMLGGQRAARVMIELDAKPVAVRQGERLEAGGATLSRAEKSAIRTQLTRTQDALKGSIKKAGGSVLGQYQDAYNGMKVRIGLKELVKLAKLPGVKAIRPIALVRPDNANGLPYTGVPGTWQATGFIGTGKKIAVIDTGIDYFHANFGGPGTEAAFDANDPTTVEPGSFPTAKVVGGYDFAGDTYDPESDDPAIAAPDPDPDPVDCNGHGSHVAGTAAGYGVRTNGTRYPGPYNGAINLGALRVGPGVAPGARLLAYKVFGCDGSTDLVIDAIEAAVEAEVDVINMSLGSSFGRPDDPDAVATDNASLSGVVVVTSSGNSGPVPYITGAPGVASRSISTAAMDALPSFPSASVDLPSAADQAGLNMNASTDLPVTAVLEALPGTTPGSLSLGCTEADYDTVDVDGRIVAVKRGECAFVDKGALAEQMGAVGIIVVNRDDVAGLPAFLGSNPEIFDIPMVGLARESQDEIVASDGLSVTLVPGPTVANPEFRSFATFTSDGPRGLDSALKPDVTAPGVSVVSTLVGSGNRGTTLSGTSMAAPHTAGLAALVAQAHPTWFPLHIKAAIVNTANPGGVAGYDPIRGGSGLVQAQRAVRTVALATLAGGVSSLSYGYEPRGAAYSESQAITLRNTSSSAITFRLTSSFVGDRHGATMTVTPSSVTVPARSTKTVSAKIGLSTAALAALPPADEHSDGTSLVSIRGAVVATPTVVGAGRYALRVPFLVVPRGTSNITAGTPTGFTADGGTASATVKLTNSGIHAGNADVYAWGESDVKEGLTLTDIRATGVQSLPGFAGSLDADDRLLLFSVNLWERWSAPDDVDVEIEINTDDDVAWEYLLVGFDLGAVLTGELSGQVVSFLVNSDFDIVDVWPAIAPMNGSTYTLVTAASSLGLEGGDSRFEYDTFVYAFHDFPPDSASGTGVFDSHEPAVSQGDFIALEPGDSTTLDLSIDLDAYDAAPTRGWMVVTNDDPNGGAQAELVPVGRRIP